MYKVILCTFFLIGTSYLSYSQPGSGGVVEYSNAQQFMNDGNGKPLFIRADYEIEGSPFYSDEYCSANIKVRNGKKYTGIKVKVNLQENIVIYDIGDGKEMAATSPVDRIDFINCNDPLKNRSLVTGFPSIDGQNGSNFYVMLDSGNMVLLKYIRVSYRDNKGYGKASTTRTFEQKEFFYAYSPTKGISRLNKDNDAVLAVFNNKKTEMAGFILKNDLKCRREEDLVKVFAYYNSIAQK